MKKKYVSDSVIAINLNVEGYQFHISFDPQYKGGSLYLTDNKVLQAAMEKHPYFGTLFRLSGDEPIDLSEIDTQDDQSSKPRLDADGNPITSEQIEEVTTCAEAKEFLEERGIASPKLPNKAAIFEAAKDMNIEFVNLK